MEKTDSIRERLLSRLPQTDNVAAYKEEVADLMSKHKRALYWDGMLVKVIMFVGLVSVLLGIVWMRDKAHSSVPPVMTAASFFIFLAGGIQGARHRISESQVALLKEIKQLQVQVLELQASLERKNDE